MTSPRWDGGSCQHLIHSQPPFIHPRPPSSVVRSGQTRSIDALTLLGHICMTHSCQMDAACRVTVMSISNLTVFSA